MKLPLQFNSRICAFSYVSLEINNYFFEILIQNLKTMFESREIVFKTIITKKESYDMLPQVDFTRGLKSTLSKIGGKPSLSFSQQHLIVQ